MIHRLFPATCRLCLEAGQAPALDLCRGCEEDFPRNDPACPVCATPLPHRGANCPGCSAGAPRGFDCALVPYRYEFPLVELIHGLKYGGQIATARILGTLLGRRIAERGRPGVDAIVPVPLFERREVHRGFNQAQELAVFASAQLRLPVMRQLARRMRDTAPQAQLPAAERRDNLKDAFVLRAVPPPRVAIVDDVLTTGATVESLARVLRAGGCRRIEVWAVARAG
ncbi:MAG TPA: ComF family protein [Steroidobacteraceae bacterium]|nr:ComF family protein [Steroidobacteraceae bacterium]